MARRRGENSQEVVVILRLEADPNNAQYAKKMVDDIKAAQAAAQAAYTQATAPQQPTSRNPGGGGGRGGGGGGGGGGQPPGGSGFDLLKGYDRDAAKLDAHLARVTSRWEASQERAANAVIRAQERAHKVTERAHKAMEASAVRVAHAAMGIGHAFALSGVAGEKTSKSMVEGLIKVEAAFMAMHGAMSLGSGLQKSYQAYGKSVAASNAASRLAGGAGTATAGVGGYLAGMGRAVAAPLGAAAVPATIAAGAVGWGMAGVNAVQWAAGVPESQRVNYKVFGGADVPDTPSAWDPRSWGWGFGGTMGILPNPWGGPGASARRSAKQLEDRQKAYFRGQAFDEQLGQRYRMESSSLASQSQFLQQQGMGRGASGVSAGVQALMQQGGRLPFIGFDDERALNSLQIAAMQSRGGVAGAGINLAQNRAALALAQGDFSRATGPDQRAAAEERILALQKEEYRLTQESFRLEQNSKQIAQETATIKINAAMKSHSYLQQEASSLRGGLAVGATGFGGMSAADQAQSVAAARKLQAGLPTTIREEALARMTGIPNVQKLADNAATMRAEAFPGYRALQRPDIDAAKSADARTAVIEEQIKIQGDYKVQVAIEGEKLNDTLQKELEKIGEKIVEGFKKEVERAIEKASQYTDKKLNQQALSRE